jgi:hypothetical protein
MFSRSVDGLVRRAINRRCLASDAAQADRLPQREADRCWCQRLSREHPRVRCLLCARLHNALGLGDRRCTTTSIACVVHVYRVFLSVDLFCDFATSSNLRRKGNWSFLFLENVRIPPRKLGGRERGTQTPLYLSNSAAFANVLTPSCVYHHVHMC